MGVKIKFDRLDYQKKAVDSISDVFKNIGFKYSINAKCNKIFDLKSSKEKLIENIKQIREKNKVTLGEVSVEDDLVIDTLMETGTGKTFTFLETIYRLNRDYELSKFIILVPSNAIRQGTIKNIKITKEFFSKEYGKSISFFDYSEKNIGNYINNSTKNISVLIATHSSFNSKTNIIHKQGIEQGLFTGTKSYMQSLAKLRPIIIMDEPHRFEGDQTKKYLPFFNPLFTLRFGATFKNDEYKNLVFTLDSIDAFSKRLVKGISVDTVGNESIDSHTIELKNVSGSTQKDYKAKISFKDINTKTKSLELKKGENLGDKAGIDFLSSYIVEKLTKKEIFFTNGITLQINQPDSYGSLLSAMQTTIVDTAIKNHFEREEELFKHGVKALCLFFIDGVSKYLKDDGSAGELAILFEKLYAKNLKKVLEKDLDTNYRKYLEKTKNSTKQIHNGYFSKSSKVKDEEEAIDLILNKKEELLSFDSDLRFIFSQWALQEGWDNPNVFTLAKLAPSNSKITKLQQIGRGLRLAVNQDGRRITSDDDSFDFINELFVVVPSTEEDFVSSIQNEISSHSIKKVTKVFNDDILKDNGIANNGRSANRLLDELEDLGVISIDEDSGDSEIIISSDNYKNICDSLDNINVKGIDTKKLKEYFDSYFSSTNRVKSKVKSKKTKIKIDKTKFAKFKKMWETLNYDSVIKYDIDTKKLVEEAKTRINKNFKIIDQDIIINRDLHVDDSESKESSSLSVEVEDNSIFTIYEFVKTLSNNTKLTMKTIASVLNEIDTEKFELIAKNENLALQKIEDELLNSIYEVIINKISYEIKEVKAKNTSFYDENGDLKDSIDISLLGKEIYPIKNKTAIDNSIYSDDFMVVDSDFEKKTIEESVDSRITVFAKIPKINIPTPHGKKYNPDFGYVIEKEGKKEIFFVVETKGYDSENDISTKEKLKIESAKRFFEALKVKGIHIEYETKLNPDNLNDMISSLGK